MESAAVSCGNYWLYPLALRMPSGTRWQAVVVISKVELGEKSITTTKSKAFPKTPMLFESEGEARAYALQFGRMLIAGGSKELPGSEIVTEH